MKKMRNTITIEKFKEVIKEVFEEEIKGLDEINPSSEEDVFRLFSSLIQDLLMNDYVPYDEAIKILEVTKMEMFSELKEEVFKDERAKEQL